MELKKAYKLLFILVLCVADPSMESHENFSAGYYDYYDQNETDYSDYYMLCEKEVVRTFIRSFLPAFYSVVFLLGLAGNALVIVIFVYFKKLKTKTEVYIMNLAIVDLLLLFTLPFWAASVVHGWTFGPALCKIVSAVYTLTFSASMQFLACISIDRYNAIVRFQDPLRIKKRCSKMCFLVWLAATCLSIPDLIFNTVHEFQGMFMCFSSFPENLRKVIKATTEILEMSLSFALPFFIMLVCYTAVARALIKNPSVKKSQPLKVLAAVVSAFIVTQLPYNVVKIWKAIDNIHPLIRDCNMSKRFDMVFLVTNSIALFHCCLNPILYFFIGTSFKMYIVKIVKHLSSWRRKRSSAVAEEIPMDYEDSEQHTSSLTI